MPAQAAGAALGWGVRDSLPGLLVVRHLVGVCVGKLEGKELSWGGRGETWVGEEALRLLRGGSGWRGQP